MARPLVRSLRSPTKGTMTEIAISQDYLTSEERVLIVDDFLFRGTTSAALADMAIEAGAELVGFAFIIEKAFAGGRGALAQYGVPVESLLCVERMDPTTGEIEFGDGRSLAALDGEPSVP